MTKRKATPPDPRGPNLTEMRVALPLRAHSDVLRAAKKAGLEPEEWALRQLRRAAR